jgi:hypothetical protein
LTALWWQHGVIYQVYLHSFQDTDGDGLGDIKGIEQRLDYLADLGVDAIWISPLYPSPMVDFGYDVTDYCGVEARFGSLADFEHLLAQAHACGLKILLDFVPNHTSDQHPWFIESRSSRNNPKRDWYIWRDPAPNGGPPNNWISDLEYRILGRMLRDTAKHEKYTTAVDIIRQLALTGCRRSEMIGLKWTEADTETSCLRLEDSKEGESIRPIGLPVVEYLERRRTDDVGTYVFPGQGDDNAFGSFPNHWKRLFEDSPLSDVTPHVLRHSFASIANDLGFTEVTIAALVGHAKGSVTSKYIHTLDTALIMAADTISGYIQGLLDGIEFKQTAYALERDSRKAALARFLKRASGSDQEAAEEERRLAA